MGKLKWGVLSTAKIGVQKVIPAMQKSRHGEVVAIASRDMGKALEMAGRLGIPRAYGEYEELLRDPAIEAVYIPLPNHLHLKWSIRALEAGKHVLCEKPVGMNLQEAEKLREHSQRKPELKVMEAFMYRYHPQWRKARDLVKSGKIGELQTIQSFFSYYNVDPGNIRNSSDAGGGSLMDIGCYCVSLSRYLFAAEPRRVMCLTRIDDEFKTDSLTTAIVDFGGRVSSFTCSTQLAPFQRVNILGTKGRIEIEIPFNAPPDRPTRIWLEINGRRDEHVFDVCDQYTLQADAFSLAVLDNSVLEVGLEDAVGNMRVIDRLFRSAETGGWIDLHT